MEQKREVRIKPADLKGYVSFGFVLHGQFGDYLYLREYIEQKMKNSRLIFDQWSQNALFLVNLNDLNEEKKVKVGGKRRSE